MGKELENKPLVEAILEIRWKLQSGLTQLNAPTDPHYKILLGRLFDRIIKDYPEYEQLPSATIPDELANFVIQHRFRVKKDSWPLVQIGPGIFSVNSTADYKWEDFRPRAIEAITKLFDAHPKIEEFKITHLVLRYVDAVGYDYTTGNAFEFLHDKLKLGISLPKSLFENTGVNHQPNTLAWQTSFKSEIPKGQINLRFATGQNNNSPVLVWDTMVESFEKDLPQNIHNDIEGWLDAAHKLTSDWFFKLIEGELERRFSGE